MPGLMSWVYSLILEIVLLKRLEGLAKIRGTLEVMKTITTAAVKHFFITT